LADDISDVPDFDPTRSDWDLSLGILLAAVHSHSLNTSYELSLDGSHVDGSVITLLGKVHLPSEFHGTDLEVAVIRSVDPSVDKQLGRGIGRLTFDESASPKGTIDRRDLVCSAGSRPRQAAR
jgi:hypothetical protein